MVAGKARNLEPDQCETQLRPTVAGFWMLPQSLCFVPPHLLSKALSTGEKFQSFVSHTRRTAWFASVPERLESKGPAKQSPLMRFVEEWDSLSGVSAADLE